MRETSLSTTTLVLRKETKLKPSSQKYEGFPCILYLKGDCKALTSQPRALSEALVGDPDVDRRRDLLPFAPGVGVVNHLWQEQVKQGSSYSKTRVFIQPELGSNVAKDTFS